MIMTKQQLQVREWSEKFGQCVSDTPTIPSLEVRKLRAKLILEEALETIEGLGLEASIDDIPVTNISDIDFSDFHITKPNLATIADGIADSIFVQLGTAVACGVDMEPIFEDVCRSNMSKLWTLTEFDTIYQDYAKGKYTCECVGIPLKGDGTERHYLIKDSTGKVIKSPSYSPANIVI